MTASSPPHTLAASAASALAEVLFRQQSWQLRKVESRLLKEGSYHLTRVSIDCVPQGLPTLRYELGGQPTSPPDGGGPEAESLLLTPVTYMRKGVLRGFDLRGQAGEPISVIGRSEYAELMLEVALVELGPAVAVGADQQHLREALRQVVDEDIETALALAEELTTLGKAHGVQVLETDALSGYAVDLLVRLAESYVLIALVPSVYANRRMVLKYSHHAKQTLEGFRPWHSIPVALGWMPMSVKFELSHPSGSASHHLEVGVPAELNCTLLTMPSGEAGSDRNTEDRLGADVVHAVGRYTEDPADSAVAEFWVPWRGLRATTFLVTLTTFAVLSLGLLLPGAQSALLDAKDGAAALLLAIPAVVVALVAGRAENVLVTALLAPLRAVAIGCAFLLLSCAASLVGVLHQPYREILWVTGTVLTAVAALLLFSANVLLACRWCLTALRRTLNLG